MITDEHSAPPQWPFSGPPCHSCPAKLDTQDTHIFCFRCLGESHALRAIDSLDCPSCTALPPSLSRSPRRTPVLCPAACNFDEEEGSQLSMDSASLSSVSGNPPGRQICMDFPSTMQAAAEAKGIPLPSLLPMFEPNGMVGEFYHQKPSTQQPSLCSRFPPIDPYIDRVGQDPSVTKALDNMWSSIFFGFSH